MKVSELHDKRKALVAERDSILAAENMTVEQEARGHEVANELQRIDSEIRSAQLRERFASYSAMEKAVGESQKRNADWVATTEYRDQFMSWMRGGQAPEQRAIDSGSSSGVLVPKIYEDGILKYLDANTVVRNLADLRTGVQGYTTVRWNTMESAGFTGSWAVKDTTATTAAVEADPAFAEKPFYPVACLPYTQVSKQAIIQSNFDLEAEIMDTLMRQLSKNLESGYVCGPGVDTSTTTPGTTNGPTGIFKNETTTNRVTATSTGTTRALSITAGLTVANLLKMRYESLPASNWANAAWIMPQDVYAAASSILANNVPILTPSVDRAISTAAGFTLFGLPVYVTEYTRVSTAAAGVNVLAVLGNIRDAFSIREWGGMTLMRDEISQAASARVRFYGTMFAQSAHTRVKSLVQLAVTNA
jgi:HK97 family phage major capsid protein